MSELRDANPEATLKALTDMLNSEGHTTKTGKPFHPMQVKRILDRRAVYEGRYKYAGVEIEGKHEPIL